MPEQSGLIGIEAAGFIISISSLAANVQRGEISLQQANEVLGVAREMIQTQTNAFSGDPASLRTAEGAIRIAEVLVGAATSPGISSTRRQ